MSAKSGLFSVNWRVSPFVMRNGAMPIEHAFSRYGVCEVDVEV